MQPGQRLGAEMLERLVVAEEEAFVGGHRLDHVAHHRFSAATAQPLRQAAQIAQLLALQDRRQPRLQQVDLVLARSPDRSGFSAASAKRSNAAAESAWLMPAPCAAVPAASARCVAAAAPRGTAPPAPPRPAFPRPRWSPHPAPTARAAGFDDPPRAGQAVLTHAGQHRDQHAAIACGRGTAQHRIHRGAAEILRRIGGQPRPQDRRGCLHQQMPIARRQVQVAGDQWLAIHRLRRRAGRPAW